MQPIQTVAIVGAGAMGAAYAALFTDASGFDVCFVARGKRYERLKNRSITVNDRIYTIGAVHPDKVTAPADLVLVALKHHHLAGAVDDIAAVTGENTAVLSVMNGLESERTIAAVCGKERLVQAIAVGIDAVYQGDRYTFGNPGKIVFGPMDASGSGPDLARIAAALERAGIANEVPDDIQRSMWWKFMINVGINQTSAVLGATYHVFQTSNEARELMRSLMQEVVALAAKAGVDLRPEDISAWDAVMMTLSPAAKTSMLQDVEAGRKTEIELFADTVVALGEKYGVPTPVNATVGRIIKVIESKT